MTYHFCRETFFPSRVVIKMSIYLADSISDEHYFFVPDISVRFTHPHQYSMLRKIGEVRLC